jgi:hypothetical protein
MVSMRNDGAMMGVKWLENKYACSGEPAPIKDSNHGEHGGHGEKKRRHSLPACLLDRAHHAWRFVTCNGAVFAVPAVVRIRIYPHENRTPYKKKGCRKRRRNPST